MIPGGQPSTKRAWANYSEHVADDLVTALLNLYSELTELGSDDAVTAGLVGVDALVDDDQPNQASRLARSVAISMLEQGLAAETLELLNKVEAYALWLDELEVGLIHYLKGEAFALLTQKREACVEYTLSAEILHDYPRNQGFALNELADVQSDLGEIHSSLKSLSRAADIFEELNEPGMLGYLRSKQGALLLKLGNFGMSRKMLDEGITLLGFADWTSHLNKSSLNLALLHLYSGEPSKADKVVRTLWDKRGSGEELATAALAGALLLAIDSWGQGKLQEIKLVEIATILGASGNRELAEKLETKVPGGLSVDGYLNFLRDFITAP
jgi:tetratricopeptide (TPR) repeat protein